MSRCCFCGDVLTSGFFLVVAGTGYLVSVDSYMNLQVSISFSSFMS